MAMPWMRTPSHCISHNVQQAANCSVGSLYHHFGSKEGIAEELFIEGIGRFNRGMVRRLRRCGGAEESVKAVVRFYSDWSTRNRALASYLHSRDIDFSEDARRRLKEIYRRYITEVFTWFGPFVASGELRALPPDAYVPLISGPIQEYVRRWLSGHYERPPRALRELFADAAWKSVRAEASAARPQMGASSEAESPEAESEDSVSAASSSNGVKTKIPNRT